MDCTYDGWFASAFGPLTPWLSVSPGLDTWNAGKDRWELYDISRDFAQANDLAAAEPGRLEEMKRMFLAEAEKNKAFPIGGGLWTRLHPEDRVKVPYTHWHFDGATRRLPEFAGPGLGRESNEVVVDVATEAGASGVLYALGGIGGGLALYMDQGRLVYEYNMMMIERYIGRSSEALTPGRHRIVVGTTIGKPAGAADVQITVDGRPLFHVDVVRTVAGAFSASETFDVGMDLGSPVSFDYFDRAPFAFSGRITSVEVSLR